MTTFGFWHWPNKTIGKRESQRLREEHNNAVNAYMFLRQKCEVILDAVDAPGKSVRSVTGDHIAGLREAMRVAEYSK